MQARERLLALGVGGLLGLWLIDTVAIEPGLAWLAAVRKDTASATRSVAEAKALVDRGPRITATWRSQLAAGLSDREDAARYHLQQAITAAARSSGCTVDAIGSGQRVPATKDQHFDILRTSVTAQGTLAQSLAFLAALEASALPLRIERSEIGSRDGRKDALDLGLTISTRISNPPRVAPEGTAPWQPGAADTTGDKAVLAAQPFSAERRALRTATGTKPTEAPTAPTLGWALVGISAPGEGQPAIAFLRHLGTQEERQGHPGDTVGDVVISELARDHLVVRQGDATHEVAIGSQFDGTPLRSTPVSAPVAATATATAPAPASATPGAPAAAPPSDGDRDAILQRLRERRNRTTGTSP
jgi:hypothetical protein